MGHTNQNYKEAETIVKQKLKSIEKITWAQGKIKVVGGGVE